MKILLTLILLITFQAEARFKLQYSVNDKTQYGQEMEADTQEELNLKLIKIATMKNGWRKGEFNLEAENALFSEIRKENCREIEGIIDEVLQTLGLIEECDEVTYYYHPTNWSYKIDDITVEHEAKEAKKLKDAQDIEALKVKIKNLEAKGDEIQQYLILRDNL